MKRSVASWLILGVAAGALAGVSSSASSTNYRAAIYAVSPDGTGRHLIASPDPPVPELVRSPDRRSILFTRVVDNQWVLFVADSSGANSIRLSPADVGAYYRDAAFSPDGQTIAFAGYVLCGFRCANYTLYAVGRDGSGLRVLASGARSPSWSPDGRRLAFSDFVGVHVLDLPTNETTLVAAHGGGPIWAPRGQRIAYTAVKGGYGVACFVNADGSRRRCTRNHSLTYLLWSPDGTRLAFKQATPRRIGFVDSDARHVRYLGYRGRYAAPVAWSPDGTRLAYRLGIYGELSGRVSAIWTHGPARPRLLVNENEALLEDVRWRRGEISYVVSWPEQP